MLIFMMNDRLSIIQSEIIKAMQESLTGDLSFHFNNGILQCVQKTFRVKTTIDENAKAI